MPVAIKLAPIEKSFSMLRMVMAGFKISAFLVLVFLFFLPLQLVILLGLKHVRGTLLKIFYSFSALCWCVKVRVRGTFSDKRPLLIVSNHTSYLDVAVLGKLLPVCFTPKFEIRAWPLIGYLCVMAGCVFIERRRDRTAQNREKLLEVLEEGRVVSLFPEGTTNNGFEVLPFHSSFFSLAEEKVHGKPIEVQPVSIYYTQRDGAPLPPLAMDKVAWYGDAEFIPHLWEYLKTRGVRAEVVIHPVVASELYADRKALARHCKEIIAMPIEDKKERLVAKALPNNGG